MIQYNKVQQKIKEGEKQMKKQKGTSIIKLILIVIVVVATIFL